MMTACTVEIVESEEIPYNVNREALNQATLEKRYDYTKSETSSWFSSRWQKPTPSSICNFFLDFVPIAKWLPKYQREFFMKDVIAGVATAVFMIPQAMAYAALAGVPPVLGLYTSFWPSLLYAVFGTSRHVSLGVFAVVCLMLGGVQQKILSKYQMNNATLSDAPPDPVEIVSTVSFLVGIILLLMAVCQLGFITTYLSEQVVGGFTTAAAIHVLSTQISGILGIKIEEYQGLFNLFYTLKAIILSLHQTNIAVLIIAIVTIPFLYIGNTQINPRFMKRFGFPISFEVIVVIIGTLVSYLFKFNSNHKIAIVSTIPKGLPPIKMPRMDLVPDLLGNSIAIAIVLFAVTISIAKLFSKKHNYKINVAQELRVYGMINLVTSVLSCCCASASLSRSSVIANLGVATQLAGFVTAGVILLVIFWIGPLLQSLPMVILACIVVVALQGMLRQFAQLKQLWPLSKVDFAIWIVAFVATVAWDLMEGLIIAVLFALATVIVRTQWPKTSRITQIALTGLYNESGLYKESSQTGDNIIIVRFDASLIFANVECFKTKLEQAVEQAESPEIPSQLNHIIIDCCGVNFVDAMGIAAICELYEMLKKRNIILFVANCRASILDFMERYNQFAKIPKKNFFPSLHDAVLQATASMADRADSICSRL